jgi:uncharacterized protein YutE (UPF0331/DUF86 family)
LKIEVKTRLIRHLTFLEGELDGIAGVRGLSWEVYQTDPVQRRNVERLVENVVNASIDISRTIIDSEALPVPDTYREIVQSMSLVAGFDKDNCERMSHQVRLRNVISHQYLDIRWSSIKRFIDETEPLYRKFVGDVKRYLAERL